MAISETMSSPSDWAQLFQHNLSGHQVAPSARHHTSTTTFGDRPSDATVVTTTVTSASIPSPSASPHHHLNPEGRVSKPIRRRSRASKRTPTTLLNTDTTNFRAMVQQFTGCPSTPFAAAPHPGSTAATNFNFGLGNSRQQMVNPAAVMVPSSGYHLQFQQQQQQQHQYHQQQHHQYMYSMGNSRPNMNVSDHGFLMEGISSRVPSRPPSSNDNTDNSSNYMF